MSNEYRLSILSEYDPIKCWLDTPKGYYVGMPDFGNNLFELQFKNQRNVRLKLHKILDKIEEDLGSDIANIVDSIELVKVENYDNFFIAIIYNNSKNVAYKEIK